MSIDKELRSIDNILIVGAARSGVAAALAARRRLKRVSVMICDRKAQPEAVAEREEQLRQAGVMLALGRQDNALLIASDLIIKSPGVPADIPLLEEARRRQIPIWGEVEFARRLLNENLMVAVTGTNGKTTTTELIGHILKSAGRPCRVAGNVGTALSSLVGEVDREEILVVELSSFQLEDSLRLKPEIAILLNLSEDHLDRHATVNEYFDAKLRIFANQGPQDLAIINAADPVLPQRQPSGEAPRLWFGAEPAAAERSSAVFERGGAILANLTDIASLSGGLRSAWSEGENSPLAGRVASAGGEDAEVIVWSRAALKGEHNLQNSMAATAACLGLGLSVESVAAGLKSFPGVRHRLQEVAVIDGVTYVNDSKATNVDAAVKAITAFPQGIHIILGGSFKGCSFDALAEAAAAGPVKEAILIGQAAPEIAQSFARLEREVIMAGGLEEALIAARAKAVSGDVVLLAPACASFDQYRNFEERGEHFIALVNQLGAGAQ